MSRMFAAVLAGSLVSPGAVAADRALLYEEALRAAVRANPTLAAAAIRSEQAEWDRKGAWGAFDPRYDLSGGYNVSRDRSFFGGIQNDSSSRRWNVGTGFDWTAPTGSSVSLDTNLSRSLDASEAAFFGGRAEFHRAGLSVSVGQSLLKGVLLSYNMQNVTNARRGVSRSELEVEKTRQDVLSQSAGAYWSWVYQVELARITSAAVETAKEALRVGNEKVESGEAAPVERTRLEAAMVQAQQSALDSENAAFQGADSLLLLMGAEPGLDLLPATAPGSVPSLTLDPGKALEVAMSGNLDVALAEADVETARLAAANARHATLPDLSANLTGSLSGVAESLGDTMGQISSASLPSFGISGQFSVPVGNRAARASAQRSLLDLELSKSQLVETRRNVSSQVLQQVRSLSSAQQQVALADINLRLSEETLEAEEALYDAGRALLKDVLEARNGVDQKRAEAAKARTDFRLAQVELMKLQGQLTVEVP